MNDTYAASDIWSTYTDSDRVELAREFLKAKDAKDYERLLRSLPLLFGWLSSPEKVEDVRSVCELMRTATMMSAVCGADVPATDEDFRGCGLSAGFSGWASAETPSNEIPVDSYMIHFSYEVKSDAYRDWLGRSIALMRERVPFVDVMRLDGRYLLYSSDLRSIEAFGTAHKDCTAILEQLFNLHLTDAALICEGHKAQHRLVTYSGISTLWLGLSEILSGGRAFRCTACGKPCLSYGERRKKEYCSDACRKWASKHPGEKREHWYIEQR